MARKLAPGQILKITKFGSWFNEDGENEIWARVIDVPVLPTKHDRADVAVIAVRGDKAADNIGSDFGSEEAWCLDDNDNYVHVIESRVPQWVWAQAAKRQLLGQANG